jgi:glutamate formiminotransferase
MRMVRINNMEEIAKEIVEVINTTKNDYDAVEEVTAILKDSVVLKVTML